MKTVLAEFNHGQNARLGYSSPVCPVRAVIMSINFYRYPNNGMEYRFSDAIPLFCILPFLVDLRGIETACPKGLCPSSSTYRSQSLDIPIRPRELNTLRTSVAS